MRHFVGIATIVLCSLGSAALAQNGQPQTHPAAHAEGAKHPAHAKKTAKAPDGFQDWVIADPGSTAKKPTDLNGDPGLAERRKHFFDQSTTMENGGPAAPGSGGGFRPSAGFNF